MQNEASICNFRFTFFIRTTETSTVDKLYERREITEPWKAVYDGLLS
jgi:hypothetical protein